ncbi:MAG: TRAP transporter substrate-binding protein DctP [Rhodospirillales bacterium]|nr:TRAP transporter substrate-binding protein DctP [Rhodospirillales bacterium]
MLARLCVLIATAWIGAMTPVSAQTTTLRFSTYVNETDIRHKGFQKFGELIQSKTAGRVKLQIFSSSTLHGFNDGMDALQGGVSDISNVTFDARLPCLRATSLYPTPIDLTKQIELDAAYTALLKDEAEKQGVVNVLNSNYSYDQEWWFKEPNVDLAKLNGKLVRSVGPLISLMIETWGGKPVFIAPKEIFQSAERGVVDGINMGVATYSSWKMWEVMPYMINANIFYGNVHYMMSKKKFDALSAEDRAAVLAAGRESEIWLKPLYENWINEQVGNAVMKGNGSAVSISKSKSAELVASVRPAWDKGVDMACGVELAGKVRSLFAKHAP